jgi:hypothetical protein
MLLPDYFILFHSYSFLPLMKTFTLIDIQRVLKAGFDNALFWLLHIIQCKTQ